LKQPFIILRPSMYSVRRNASYVFFELKYNIKNFKLLTNYFYIQNFQIWCYRTYSKQTWGGWYW